MPHAWRPKDRRAGCGVAALVVTAFLAGGPFAAAATTTTVLGGKTSQGWPVVVELNASHRQIVRITAALRLPCASGFESTIYDYYVKMTPSSSGRFAKSFGPLNVRNQDGTTIDYSGSISGTLNKAHTKATGTWHLKGVYYDVAGAVTDTCDLGTLTWSAKD